MTKCCCKWATDTNRDGGKNAFNSKTVIGDAVVITHIFSRCFSSKSSAASQIITQMKWNYWWCYKVVRPSLPSSDSRLLFFFCCCIHHLMSTYDIHAVLISQVSSTYFFQFPAHSVHTGSLRPYYIRWPDAFCCHIRSAVVAIAVYVCIHDPFFSSAHSSLNVISQIEARTNHPLVKHTKTKQQQQQREQEQTVGLSPQTTSATWIQTTNDYNIIMKIIIAVLLSNFSLIKCVDPFVFCEHWTDQTTAYVFCVRKRARIRSQMRASIRFCFGISFISRLVRL